jgi:hypothetical protein
MLNARGQSGGHCWAIGDLRGQNLAVGGRTFHLFTALVGRIWDQVTVGRNGGVTLTPAVTIIGIMIYTKQQLHDLNAS